MPDPPGPLSRLSAYFAKGEPPPLPPAPPRPTFPTPPPMAPRRIPVQDTRDVGPFERVAGNYQQGPMEDVAREALINGMPPDLALAMTIRENSSALANPRVTQSEGTQNPMTLGVPPAYGSSPIEASIHHAIERASAVSPAGVDRQVQAYNGLGRQAPGYNLRFKDEPNPYASAVNEIKDRVVNASPALRALIANVTPKLSLDPMPAERLAAVSDAITRRVRHPNLWK